MLKFWQKGSSLSFASASAIAAGALIGMILGITASFFLAKAFSLPFTIAASSVALAIGVSGAIETAGY